MPENVQIDKTEVHIIFSAIQLRDLLFYEIALKSLWQLFIHFWMQLYTLGSNKLSHQVENTQILCCTKLELEHNTCFLKVNPRFYLGKHMRLHTLGAAS